MVVIFPLSHCGNKQVSNTRSALLNSCAASVVIRSWCRCLCNRQCPGMSCSSTWRRSPRVRWTPHRAAAPSAPRRVPSGRSSPGSRARLQSRPHPACRASGPPGMPLPQALAWHSRTPVGCTTGPPSTSRSGGTGDSQTLWQSLMWRSYSLPLL